VFYKLLFRSSSITKKENTYIHVAVLPAELCAAYMLPAVLVFITSLFFSTTCGRKSWLQVSF